jgi:DnaK suppressor protein
MQHLTSEQRATLDQVLQERRRTLEVELAEHRQDLAALAPTLADRAQNNSAYPPNANDREVETALSTLDAVELAAVHRAQKHLHDDNFGICVDCTQAIPFARLLIEPEALRCVACASIFERKL